jgi:hypothetical protein
MPKSRVTREESTVVSQMLLEWFLVDEHDWDRPKPRSPRVGLVGDQESRKRHAAKHSSVVDQPGGVSADPRPQTGVDCPRRDDTGVASVMAIRSDNRHVRVDSSF